MRDYAQVGAGVVLVIALVVVNELLFAALIALATPGPPHSPAPIADARVQALPDRKAGFHRRKDVAVRTSPRSLRVAAFTLALALPVLAACGSSGSSGGSGSSPTTRRRAARTRSRRSSCSAARPSARSAPYCLIGLQEQVRPAVQVFKALDAGGPLTVAALKNGSIQVGLLFTTNGQIAANGWVLLQDDKVLQPADNVTPVLNNKITDAYGSQLTQSLNAVCAKLTTEGLTDDEQADRRRQEGSRRRRAAVARRQRLQGRGAAPAKTGPTIIVGSANFTEDVTLADIYADWLDRNGYPVSKKLSIGSRELYFPQLKSGGIDLIPDYAGSLLTFINPNQPATTDPNTNAHALATALAPSKLTALNYSKAQDINGFVVTKDTADKYGLVKISDLSKSAS